MIGLFWKGPCGMRRIRFRSSITAAAIACLLVAAGAAVRSPAGTRTQADVRSRGQRARRTEARLLDEIKYLASDELEGRGIGTEGLDKAADYMRREFQAAGLDVTRVHGGAFQSFSMSVKAKLASPNSMRFLSPDGKATDLKQNVDFRPCAFGGSGKIEGELVFAGYAIDSCGEPLPRLQRRRREGKGRHRHAASPAAGRSARTFQRSARRYLPRRRPPRQTEQCDRGRRQRARDRQ